VIGLSSFLRPSPPTLRGEEAPPRPSQAGSGPRITRKG
jgi:hypothetical protein